MKWLVKYQQISFRNGRYPFFKQTKEVEAINRKESINKVKENLFNLNDYDNFHSSRKD